MKGVSAPIFTEWKSASQRICEHSERKLCLQRICDYLFIRKNSLKAKWSDFLVQKTLKLICYIRVKEKDQTAFKACWKGKMYPRTFTTFTGGKDLTCPIQRPFYERLILSLSCLSLCKPAFKLPSFQKDSNWRMKLQLNLLEREEEWLEVGLGLGQNRISQSHPYTMVQWTGLEKAWKRTCPDSLLLL